MSEAIDINDIIQEYDFDEKEIAAVSKVGRLVSERLSKNEIMRWTVFPDRFARCRSESNLWQTINDYNNWLEVSGMIVEDEEDENDDDDK